MRPSEVENGSLRGKRMARESIVAIKDISPHIVITEDMAWVKRPGTGIPAKDLEKIIGKRSKRKIMKDILLRREDPNI